MKKIIITVFLIFFNTTTYGSVKENIIQNLAATHNFNFNFEQNINGKIETGKCIVQYPGKIFCKYNLANNKILVSNGKSIIIKTKSSYYKYPIARTPLKQILDKNFLINQIKILDERNIDNKFINFTIVNNDNEINIFFNKDNYNLIGWQVLDIYQNLNITFISSVKKNLTLKKNIFQLPLAN